MTRTFTARTTVEPRAKVDDVEVSFCLNGLTAFILNNIHDVAQFDCG